MNLLLEGDHPVLSALRVQFKRAEIGQRESTEAHSQIQLTIAEDSPKVRGRRDFQLLDVFAELEESQREVGFILFVEDGALARLECYADSGGLPPGARPRRFYYKSPLEPGSSKLVETKERDLGWLLGNETDRETVDVQQEIDSEIALPEQELRSDPYSGLKENDMSRTRFRTDPAATQSIAQSSRLGVVEKVEEAMLPKSRRRNVVLYSVALGLLCPVGLALLIAYAWYLQPDQSLAALDEEMRRYVLTNTLFTMLIAGAAGGALANLRDFLTIGQQHSGLPERLEVPFYLRPLTAGVMGVVVFFLTNFFIAVLSVGSTTQGWALLHGRLAYVALALVTGFGVQEVLSKLRDVAATVLAPRN